MNIPTAASVVGEAMGVHSGMIQWEVDNVSELNDDFRYSPTIEVEALPWQLIVFKRGNSSYLGVALKHIVNESNLWSLNVALSITLINEDSENNVSKIYKKVYDYKIQDNGVHYLKFLKWSDVIDEQKTFLNDIAQGFITDDTITLEARITLSNIVGFRKTPVIDFTNPEPRHDTALVIDGQKIYVSKQYLSLHSPFFNAMFYSEFAEKNKEEIELKDVNREEFIEMLNVIYPSQAKITELNAVYLLALGDRFQIKMVIDKVEQFLITSTDLTVPDKLKLSDQFRLVDLQDHCLRTFKTIQDIKAMKNTEGYKSLSDKALSALMEKVMNLQ